MPVTLNQHLESLSGTPMNDFYVAEGITPQTLAQEGKRLLQAKTAKHIKLKGWFDKRKKLAPGYKVIKGTTDETLVECLLNDNGVQARVWVEICKQMGLYPSETVKVQHGFDDVIGKIIKDIHDGSKGLPPLPSEET